MVQEPPKRVERRLSAILAADVAGYSRLMHNDEETTHAKLTALLAGGIEPAIVEHGGRIVKNTGDGFLAEFPSAVEAVRAAVQFQAHIMQLASGDGEDGRIFFRVGINIGDVIAEPHDIFGDDVNVAARLEGIADPGGICISSSVYERVRGKVGIEFTDLGEQNLKNIAWPVRAYAAFWDGGLEPRTRSGIISLPSAPRLSIVVLPFANIGGGPEQEYFVDGVTESLTTDLSRISGSLVIGRHTAFTFKGKAVDLKQIGRELNVRYVLEGSVQRGGNRLRVNVQLIDAETGNHLWAERFDKAVTDIFDVQDEIVSRIANTLNTQLIEAEARRAERSPHPDALDLYFQGMAWFNKGFNPDDLAQARGNFEKALARDPGNVEALVGFAYIEGLFFSNYLSGEGFARLAASEAALIRALTLAPENAMAHMVLGGNRICSSRALQGIAECERALELNRNLAEAHAFIGAAKTLIGTAAETEAHVLEALRISPRDTAVYRWLHWGGIAKLMLGVDVEAVRWLRRSLEANRNNPIAHFHLGAALMLLQDQDEAREAVKAGLKLHPTITIRRMQRLSDNPTYLAQARRVRDGMRLAGVPVG